MIGRGQAENVRDEAEALLQPAVDAAMRRFLTDTATAAAEQLPAPALVAAGGRQQPVTLGELAGWWATAVDQGIVAAVQEVWAYCYDKHSGKPIERDMQASGTYVSKVRDRLVQGLVPPVYADSFDQIRESIALSGKLGWSRPELAEDIAARLSWAPQRDYWQRVKDKVDRRLAAALDQYGPPGTRAREAAKQSPELEPLYRARNRAVASLDADKTEWQVRATRIARTEATGANNHAALQALTDEGRSGKMWCAARDERTREDHRDADGQTVGMGQPFIVGGYAMQMPGDPSAPASEVVSCRCFIVGRDL